MVDEEKLINLSDLSPEDQRRFSRQAGYMYEKDVCEQCGSRMKEGQSTCEQCGYNESSVAALLIVIVEISKTVLIIQLTRCLVLFTVWEQHQCILTFLIMEKFINTSITIIWLNPLYIKLQNMLKNFYI